MIPQGTITTIKDFGHELVILFDTGDVLVVSIMDEGDYLVWEVR